jgi:predicted RNA-binding protein with TRAM domain
MKKGNEYELTIVDTEFPGYGIAKLEGTDVYVKNVVPGQKILGRITKREETMQRQRPLKYWKIQAVNAIKAALMLLLAVAVRIWAYLIQDSLS